MPEFFAVYPGRLYVVATLLPLVPAALLLFVITARNLTRPYANAGGMAGRVYGWLNRPSVDLAGAWLSVAVMAAAAGIAGFGLWNEASAMNAMERYPEWYDPALSAALDELYLFTDNEELPWIRMGQAPVPDNVWIEWPSHATRFINYSDNGGIRSGVAFEFGYRIDTPASLMFTMVTMIATLIFVFSIGYLADERVAPSHSRGHVGIYERGRFSRYFLLVNIFVAAMLNMIIATNLLQIFVSWELVGVCSFFLIGYYDERPTPGWAANKAFLVNRIGDVGLLVAMAAMFTQYGTLDVDWVASIENSFDMSPVFATEVIEPPPNRHLFLTIIGAGIFLACVGKSAQFPLQVWLPDAMAGPTPVSALIHAATMVAAGVYLVARCYPLFTPDVMLVIAYTGCVTLFVAATAACVQTDIKKVLAYSTISQLGFMMLALGVGGWAAGLFHLITHAFFKALLFLGAGSVIHGLNHEQDLRKMGGLRRKMPITAYTMLVGVLAISGFPLLSGWYSKEAILTRAVYLGFGEPLHAALVIVPFMAAGLTAFYMLRLWLLTFSGEPRDEDLHHRAHESPRIMTIPLMILAVFSIAIGWGWPVWEAGESYLLWLLIMSSPLPVDWAPIDIWQSGAYDLVEKYHLILELAAGGIALVGFTVAYWRYALRTPTFAGTAEPTGFFARGWYFDALYDYTIRRPTQKLATLAAAADKASPDAPAPSVRSLDGMLNGVGRFASVSGSSLRSLQTGRVRGYVAILGLTVVGVLGMLAVLTR